MIGVVEYADPGDEDEERPLHRAVARRALDALTDHARLCGVCILHGAARCQLVRFESWKAGIRGVFPEIVRKAMDRVAA